MVCISLDNLLSLPLRRMSAVGVTFMILLALLGSLFAAPPANAAEVGPPKATISGTVSGLLPAVIEVRAFHAFDGANTDPLYRGTVAVTNVDGNGRYQLELPAGSYRILLSGNGYAPQWNGGAARFVDAPVLSLRSGSATTQNFQMKHLGSLRVNVGNTAAVADDNLWLAVYDRLGQRLATSPVDKDATYRWDNVTIGEGYRLALISGSHETVWWGTSRREAMGGAQWVTIKGDAPTAVDFNWLSDANYSLRAPKLTGGTSPGSVLQVDSGEWAPVTPKYFTRQWLRDGKPIGAPVFGLGGEKYVLTAADAGHRISVVTSWQAAGLLDAEAVSNALSIPKPVIVKASSKITAKASKLRKKKAGKVKVTVSANGKKPTGSVSIYRGSTRLGKATLSNGARTIKIKALSKKGRYKLTIKYSGDHFTKSSVKSIKVRVS